MLSQKSSRKITVLSFILFIGVMTIHTHNLDVYGIEQSDGAIAIFETFTNKLAVGICVPYFYAISGLLFFRNFDMSSLFKKYKSRCRSIVVPYFVWNTLYYLFFLFITRIPFMSGMINNADIEFGVKAYMDYVWNGYYTFWFLRVLIWMIICTPVLWFLLKKRKYYWPEIVLAVLIILELNGKSVPGTNIYYFLGTYLGANCCDILNKDNQKLATVSAVCFVGILAAGGSFAGNVVYNCFFIITSWLALDLFHFSQEPKWWMKCTFFFYCAHDIVLEALEKIILILFGRSRVMALVDYILAPVLTLLILISIAGIMKKYAKPIWNVLSGGR